MSISESTLRKSRDSLKLANKYTQTSLVDSESWQYGKFRAHGVQKLHTGKNHDQGHSRNRGLGKKHRLIFSSHPAKFSRMVEWNAMYHELAHVQQHLPYAWRCEPLECYIGQMKLISWAPPKYFSLLPTRPRIQDRLGMACLRLWRPGISKQKKLTVHIGTAAIRRCSSGMKASFVVCALDENVAKDQWA